MEGPLIVALMDCIEEALLCQRIFNLGEGTFISSHTR